MRRFEVEREAIRRGAVRAIKATKAVKAVKGVKAVQAIKRCCDSEIRDYCG